MMQAVIVSAVRTPIAKKGGALKDLHPAKYGGLVIQEALKRAQIDGNHVEDVIFGNWALVTKLLYELKYRNLKRGLVTACIGGGQGIALILER